MFNNLPTKTQLTFFFSSFYASLGQLFFNIFLKKFKFAIMDFLMMKKICKCLIFCLLRLELKFTINSVFNLFFFQFLCLL